MRSARRRTTTKQAAIAAAAIAMLAGAAACSDDSRAEEEGTGGSTAVSAGGSATAPATPREKAALQAEKAILRYYDTYLAVMSNPAAGPVAFKKVAAGKDLEYLQIEWRQFRSQRVHVVGTGRVADITTTDVTIRGNQAVVKADVCYDVSDSDVVHDNQPTKSAITKHREPRQQAHMTVTNTSWPRSASWRVTYNDAKGAACA